GGALYMATKNPMPPAVKSGFILPYNSWETRIATHRFVHDIPMHKDVPSYQVLKEIDSKLETLREKPMLIEWGALDFCFTTYFYNEWKRRFPDAQSDLYEDASHYLLEDKGDVIIPKIESFLKA
ncbi:MAG: alpha/beta hydrolase, partial [Planctomycetes bacterium]|nr:alpha/beta hydrolase [Planctomycetota bacterium]